MTSMTDPGLYVRCSKCKMPPDRWCVTPSTGRRYTHNGKQVLHQVRRLAAVRMEELVKGFSELLSEAGYDSEIGFQDGQGDVDYPYSFKVYAWKKEA